MKSHTGFLCLLLTVSLAFIATKQASALTYQQGAGVNFTFNSALSVTLSSSDIVINNLVAGTSSDSNIITVNVKTNSAGGYTLNATVGNSTYGHRNLANSNVAENFTSLDYGSSVASLNSFSDNKWGYSFSTNDGSSWSDYSGLPLYTDATNVSTLKATTGPSAVDGDNIKFKIGARASINQPSGEYRNVINFTLVAEPTPVTLSEAYASANKTMLNGYYKMQDMDSSICSAVEVYGDESAMQVIDTRDNKTYWIAKLADDNCWMTQNLDLDISSSRTYTNQDTDLGWNGSSYSTASWSPSRSTYSTTSSHIHEWCNGGTWNTQYGYCEENDTPESYDPGNLYWNSAGSDNSDWDTYYNSCDYSTSTPSCNQSLNPIFTYVGSAGTAQFHLGNYYNWAAALATNDSSVYDDDDLVEQSICPTGWTLPKIGTGNDSFQALWEEYGYDENDGFSDISTLWTSPLYFIAGGHFDGSLVNVGFHGYFWSSVASYSGSARDALFYVYDNAYPLDYSHRDYGYSVRCLAR